MDEKAVQKIHVQVRLPSSAKRFPAGNQAQHEHGHDQRQPHETEPVQSRIPSGIRTPHKAYQSSQSREGPVKYNRKNTRAIPATDKRRLRGVNQFSRASKWRL